MRLDVVLFPITLYFYALQSEFTLAAALPKARHFAQEGMRSEQSASTRLAATQLDISVRELGQTIAERVLRVDKQTEIQTVFRQFLEREQ